MNESGPRASAPHYTVGHVACQCHTLGMAPWRKAMACHCWPSRLGSIPWRVGGNSYCACTSKRGTIEC